MWKTFFQRTARALIIPTILLLPVFAAYYHTVASGANEKRAAGEGNLLAEAFGGTGANFRKLDLQGWSQVNGRYTSAAEMQSMLKRFVSELGIEEAKTTTQIQTENSSYVLTKTGWLDPATHVTAIMRTRREPESHEDAETYLIVGFSHFGTPKNYSLLRTKMVRAFQPIADDVQYSTIISGSMAKKIEVSEMQNMTKMAFEKAGAKIMESHADARMVSVTGYTPAILNRLTLGAKKVNINMAVRYDAVANNTLIYLGSPIITTEY